MQCLFVSTSLRVSIIDLDVSLSTHVTKEQESPSVPPIQEQDHPSQPKIFPQRPKKVFHVPSDSEETRTPQNTLDLAVTPQTQSPTRPSTPTDSSSSSKRVLGRQYTVNPASLPSPPKCSTPLPPSGSQPSIPVTNPLPPVTPLVTTVPSVVPMTTPSIFAPPSTVPPSQPPANPVPPPANPMSTTTGTNTVRDALPEVFSGETEDAIRWVNAMEAYFRVNPSTFTSDDVKSVTLLNRMGKGQGKYFVDTWLRILADKNIKSADKDFDHVKQVFANMFYPYHADETARDELETLKQVSTRKDDGFQTYLSKFQYLVAQAQVGNTPAIRRLFAEGLDLQITTMIYSMEKVPTTLKAWMEKAIDFHKQQARIKALKN